MGHDPNVPVLECTGAPQARTPLRYGSGGALRDRHRERYLLAGRAGDRPGDHKMPSVVGQEGNRINRV
jgi:hypothetical protein